MLRNEQTYLCADVEVLLRKVCNVKIFDVRGSYTQTLCPRPITGNCRRSPTQEWFIIPFKGIEEAIRNAIIYGKSIEYNSQPKQIIYLRHEFAE